MVRSVGLGICAGLMVLACGPIVQAQPAAKPIAQTTQQQAGEIDRIIEEGMRLFKEGSAESLRKAIGQFENALELARSAKVQDRQALALLVLGRINNDLGEKQKALNYYNQSLLLFRIVGDRSSEATVLNSIGAVYNDLGEKQKALDYYNQVLPIRRAVGDRLGEATTLNNVGLVYDTLGEKQKALEYYNQALLLYRAVGDSSEESLRKQSGKATTLNNIGLVYDTLGEKQKALEYYNQALSLYRAVGIRSGEATTLNNIGTVYSALGEKQKALDYYNQALPLSRTVGDRSGEATALSNIGLVYDTLGEKQKSLEYYNQALPIRRAVGDRSGEATTLTSIGNVYKALGEQQKALEYYNQALPIRRAVGDRSGEATTLNNIGSVYHYLGEKQKALEYYNQALPIRRAVGDRSGEAMTLSDIGSVYNTLGEKQKALEYYNQALPIFRAVSDRSGEATTLNNIGTIYNALGEEQKALEYYNRALPILRAVGDRSVEAITFSNIGGIYDKLGETEKSLKHYNQALPILRAVGDRSGEARAFNNIGFLFKNQNQTEVAITFFKKSISIYETLRQDIKALSRSQQATYTQTISDTYRELANLLIQQNRLAEAQQVIELLKIGELKEIEPDKFKFNTPIRQLPISDSEKQEIAKINPEIAKEIQPEPLPKPDQLSLTNPLNQSAQALTKPNSALIYHLITADKLWIILVTPDGKLQRFASSETKAQLETLTQSIRSQLEKCERSTCTTTDTQALNQTTQTLYEQLFPADLKTALAQTKHLTFALDGSLRNIPIAALYTGQQYLIEKYTLSSIIAAQLTDSQDKIPSNAQDSPILALGTSQSARLEVPDFIKADRQDRFAALGNVPIELNAILRSDRNPKAFPGKQLLNDQFTLPNIQQQLPNHRILHIASHGIFRPNSLDYSYILLGNQKRWSIAALDQDAQLFQNLHLITLSACQTGLSDRDKNGMEIAGMSHAFLSKGAKAINASLWSIDDASTAILMQQFYQNLTQNQSKAQALQTAQLHLLRTPRSQLITELSRSMVQPPGTGIDTRMSFESPTTPAAPIKTRDYSHPYYWAAFTLIGNSL